MKKRRCYLCGGKLVNGRCTLCGLDNTKIERKNYRLNESSFDGKGIEAKHLCESHNGKPSGGLNRQGRLPGRADETSRDRVPGRMDKISRDRVPGRADRTGRRRAGKRKSPERQKKGMDFNNLVLHG